MEGRLGRDALDAATKKSNIRIVATQSFSFTQESVVNSVPLVRAAAKIYDADLLYLRQIARRPTVASSIIARGGT